MVEKMKRIAIVFSVLLLVALFGFVALFGCVQPTEKVVMNYNVNECSRDEATGVWIERDGNVLHIKQVESYVCCANITITMNTSEKTIRIYEENIGEMCRCICPFKADIYLHNTVGYENVEIYGVKFRDVYGYELKHNISLTG